MFLANTYGWEDLIAPIATGRVAGANVPTWAQYRDDGAGSNGIYAYRFSATALNEVWLTLHVLHDYAPRTVMYPHIHWSPNTTSTGVVRWGIEYTIQKGHQQGAFPTTSVLYLEDTVSSDAQYMHRIVESEDDNVIPATNLETDALILMRMFRDGAHSNDTFPDAVFAFQLDIHYTKGRFATIGKRPDFDTPD